MSPDPSSTATPETVLVTLRVQDGKGDEAARILADHWAVCRRLDLVFADPHVTVRGRDGAGKVYLVELFTWKDAAVTGNPPPEIQALWQRMHEVGEGRDGRPAIDIAEVERLSAPA